MQRLSAAEINRLQAQIKQLEKAKNPTTDLLDELKKLRLWLKRVKHRRALIGFIDPIDLRFNTFRPETRPNYKAVIFV